MEKTPDARRLHISGEKGVGEESLVAHWPRAREADVITVAATRPPESIARDVERRLLPLYLKALAQARKTKEEHDAAEAATARLVAELVGILHGRETTRTPGGIKIGNYSDPVHGDVLVTRHDVAFTVTVPLGQAKQFALHVAQTAGGPPNQGRSTHQAAPPA